MVCLMSAILLPYRNHAQKEDEIRVEESAEVFLEDYSDAFQENFFEGLKQKGIQNYDKAINALLECKRMEPDNIVVSHELAKTYYLDKKYIQSQEYAVEAVSEAPENYWYLNTLITTTSNRGIPTDNFKASIPWNNEVLQKNLATIYFKDGKLEDALKTVKGLGNDVAVKHLEQKITDSISKKKEKKENISAKSTSGSGENPEMNTLEQLKSNINSLLMNNDMDTLLEVSEEAMENYPSQPYFYYTNGYALNRTKDYKGAIEILETALDYLINDVPLSNKIYQELSDAYNATDNPSKANMYLSKIKPGF